MKKYYFPKTDNYEKLQSDYVGEYSISKPNDAQLITNIIKKFILITGIDINIITDGTAGLGGNTISFCRNFDKVIANEIYKPRYDMLCSNLKVYNIENCKIYNQDLLSLCENIYQDAIFVDPPWGGVNYKDQDVLNLTLSGIPIEKVMEKLLHHCKVVIIKLPKNHNLTILNEKFKNKIKITPLKKMLIVIVYN